MKEKEIIKIQYSLAKYITIKYCDIPKIDIHSIGIYPNNTQCSQYHPAGNG